MRRTVRIGCAALTRRCYVDSYVMLRPSGRTSSPYSPLSCRYCFFASALPSCIGADSTQAPCRHDRGVVGVRAAFLAAPEIPTKPIFSTLVAVIEPFLLALSTLAFLSKTNGCGTCSVIWQIVGPVLGTLVSAGSGAEGRKKNLNILSGKF